ncbi:MAG: hypothetical protein ABJD11_09670 [Gemmatimonadota bacterium]
MAADGQEVGAEPVPARGPGRPEAGAVQQWLVARLRNAPPSLRERVRKHAADAPARFEISSSLAATAQRVLAQVMGHPGDRSIALDLLAADGLITLALLAQAEMDPDGLEAFASRLLSVDPTIA